MLNRKVLATLTCLFLGWGLTRVSAQEVQHLLSFSDGTHLRELYFGLDPAATDAIDFPLEIQFPPLPPGLLEVLFIGEDIGFGSIFGHGTMSDYRAGDASFGGTVQHEVKLRLGVGQAITVTWNLPAEVTGTVQDVGTGGGLLNDTLVGAGSALLHPAVTRAIFTITYAPIPPDPLLTRGDCNADGPTNIADAVFGLGVLFSAGGPEPCTDACDANDDGSFNIADMVALLTVLFGGGAPLPPPGDCAADPTPDTLDCLDFPPCT